MGSIQYNPDEYIALLTMSSKKFLLVEGRADKRLFQFLLYELFNKVSQAIPLDSIVIDCAEDLIKVDNSPSNRQKVELVCKSIQKTPLASKLIGFVDREFREFGISGVPEDKLKKHNVIDGVVWSRGHSIENYCFDFLILRSSLLEHSDIDRFDLALDLFKKIFGSILHVACAFSLAAEELGQLQRVRGCINWNMVEVNLSEVKLRPDVLQDTLVNKAGKDKFTENEYILLLQSFYKWHQKIEKVESACVRWLCHGHIGMSFVWGSYGQCVCEAYKMLGIKDPESEVPKVFQAKEKVRFRTCIISWIRSALDNAAEYPREILSFFDLSVP